MAPRMLGGLTDGRVDLVLAELLTDRAGELPRRRTRATERDQPFDEDGEGREPHGNQEAPDDLRREAHGAPHLGEAKGHVVSYLDGSREPERDLDDPVNGDRLPFVPRGLV